MLSTEIQQLPSVEPGIIKVKLRVTSHNAVLLNRRKALNLTQRDIEIQAGLKPTKKKKGRPKKYPEFENPYESGYNIYADIELLKKWPTEQQRIAICDVLGLQPEEAFPHELYLATGLPTIKRDIEVESQIYIHALNEWKELQENWNDPHRTFEERIELPKLIQDTLDTLTGRERDVINLLFGLSGNEEMTLGEMATKFGLSHTRIAQIRDRAISLIKNNKIAQKLLDYSCLKEYP